jgi:chitinase
MKRRLFLSGSAAAALTLVGCGGGGGGSTAADAGAGAGASGNLATASTLGTTGAAFPDKILGCYYTAFDTQGLRLTDIPSDFNVIYLFHAKPAAHVTNGNWNNQGDGSFEFQHYADIPVADIQACRARGQKVILTVGGANAGYNFDNRAKSQNFVNSFKVMHDRLGGVDGCDFNNFEANIGSSPAEMIWISQQLKAMFGQGFAITAPPQPNSPEDRAMLKAMSDAGVLTWAAPQYYDWSGFNAAGFVANRTNDWVADLGAEKVVLGLSANYHNGPSLQDCIREWNAVKAAHPSIRGAFCWNAQLNIQGTNAWGSAMKAIL